jgi:hypothetical protein
MKVRFKEGIGEIYLQCMTAFEDEEYCRGLIKAVKEASRGRYVYGTSPKFHLVLPDVEYVGRIFVDGAKDYIVITLQYTSHAVFLHFTRSGGDFILSRAELLNVDIAAMYNGRPPV